ncbi:MAG TPA: hypothetical protein DD417_00965 [Elusimicrobia bacterium]|nr:hypothetical protein [Elusimicrobiota bacterium]
MDNESDKSLRRRYAKTSTLASSEPVEPVHLRFPKPRRLIALRMDDAALDAIRRIAARKGLNYSTLMRMWLTERLHLELGK